MTSKFPLKDKVDSFLQEYRHLCFNYNLTLEPTSSPSAAILNELIIPDNNRHMTYLIADIEPNEHLKGEINRERIINK